MELFREPFLSAQSIFSVGLEINAMRCFVFVLVILGLFESKNGGRGIGEV